MKWRSLVVNPDVWTYTLINAELILMKLHFILWLLLLLQPQTFRLFCVLRSDNWCVRRLCIQYSKYNTRRKTEELSFECRPEQRIFLYSKAHRPVPDFSQLFMQCACWLFLRSYNDLVVKMPNHLSPNTELKNECSYKPTYILSNDFMVCTATT